MRVPGVFWLAGSAFLLAFAYSRIHPKIVFPSAAEQTQEPEAKPEEKQAEPMVKFVGPLANFMQQHTGLHLTNAQPRSKPHPSDHIAESPVGTTMAILHKTFAIRARQAFSFEIPAHAAHPQFHGTYRSFAKDFKVSDESADVEFLLMTDPQYQSMLAGRPGEALFAAEASHSQDVDVELPASSDRVVKYHMMFRSASGGAAQKIVEANFSVDF